MLITGSKAPRRIVTMLPMLRILNMAVVKLDRGLAGGDLSVVKPRSQLWECQRWHPRLLWEIITYLRIWEVANFDML